MIRRRSGLSLSTLGFSCVLLLLAQGCTGEEAASQEPSNPGRSPAIQETEAQAVLAAGLAEAERTGRLVFLHSGAPW